VTRFRWATATDVGRVRNVNQDNAFSVEGFFAVADGMGGHRGGEVASAVALESLSAALPVLSTDDLLDAISDSNLAVLERANADPSLRGMGTTLCVLALVDDGSGEPSLILANVGDSRIYQYGNGVLEQRTDDHSMVAEMMRQGRLTAEEAGSHPQRNILTRALGIDAGVQIDAWRVAPTPGQRWMLCSDGLFNEVDDETLASVLASYTDPADAANELVRLANAGGGRDNITVLVVDVIDDDDHAVIATPAEVVPVEADAPDATGTAVPHRVPTVAASTPRRESASVAGSTQSHKASLGRRVVDSWRVVLFASALVAVAAVAVISWRVLRDDPSVIEPPPPTTSTSTTEVSTTSTTAPIATTTTPLSVTAVPETLPTATVAR
jgi:protein phosphatase